MTKAPDVDTIAVRAAVAADVAALADIAEAAFAPYVPLIGRRPAPMDADLDEAVRGGAVLVARRGNDVVGYVVLWREGDAAELATVAVHPSRHGQGVGRKLIAAAETMAQRSGARVVRLYTNAAMRANLSMYPHLGYHETGRAAQAGFDRVFFEKTLPPMRAQKAPVDKIYGRRRVQSHRDAPGLATYALDLDAPAELAALFPAARAMRMEVGFGGGEHLIHHAESAPDVGLIGVEPFETGMMRAVRGLEAQAITNVRVYMGDARRVLDWLPDDALDRVDILYPDPWPKQRHWKRRFVSLAGLDRLARVLPVDATVRVASDIADYVAWTRSHAAAHPAFTLAQDSATAWEGWPGTRYEAKAFREGRVPRYLTLVRVADR